MFRHAREYVTNITRKPRENRDPNEACELMEAEETVDIDTYVQLISSILNCRKTGKYLIVGLCDKGTSALEDLVEKGDNLIEFLVSTKAVNDECNNNGSTSESIISEDESHLLNSKRDQSCDHSFLNGDIETTSTMSAPSDNFVNSLGIPKYRISHNSEEGACVRNSEENEQKSDVIYETLWDCSDNQEGDNVISDGLRANSQDNSVQNRDEDNSVHRESWQITDYGDNSFMVIDESVAGVTKDTAVSQELLANFRKVLNKKEETINNLQKEIHQLKTGMTDSKTADEGVEFIDLLETALDSVQHIHKTFADLTLQSNKQKFAFLTMTDKSGSNWPSIQRCLPRSLSLERNEQNDTKDFQLEKMKELENLVNELQQQIEELETARISLLLENSNLTQRLSEEMNAKVSADETNLENVAIINRPMNVADQYNSLCSAAWHDAKTTLDQTFEDFPEEIKLKLLCEILMVSEREASSMFGKFMKGLITLLTQPIDKHTQWKDSSVDHDTDGRGPQPQIPTQLLHTLQDYVRTMADSVSIQALVKGIQNSILGCDSSEKNTSNKDDMLQKACSIKPVQAYIEGSARLAWKMVIQRPPMTFDNKTGLKAAWQDNHQEVHYGSDDPNDPKSRVQLYVHPTLSHSGSVMVKGRVCVKK